MQFTQTLHNDFKEWHNNIAKISVSLLVLITVGLIIALVILVTTFKNRVEELKDEKKSIRRKKLSFTIFVLGYLVHAIVKLGVALSIHDDLIPKTVTRWYLISTLPLIESVPSILIILILHHLDSYHAIKNSEAR